MVNKYNWLGGFLQNHCVFWGANRYFGAQGATSSLGKDLAMRRAQNTRFFILEAAMLLFRTSPLTEKTDYRRYLIFGMDTHQVPTGGPTEAIFDIWPLSRVMGV